jgi:hypothetical protein
VTPQDFSKTYLSAPKHSRWRCTQDPDDLEPWCIKTEHRQRNPCLQVCHSFPKPTQSSSRCQWPYTLIEMEPPTAAKATNGPAHQRRSGTLLSLAAVYGNEQSHRSVSVARGTTCHIVVIEIQGASAPRPRSEGLLHLFPAAARARPAPRGATTASAQRRRRFPQQLRHRQGPCRQRSQSRRCRCTLARPPEDLHCICHELCMIRTRQRDIWMICRR